MHYANDAKTFLKHFCDCLFYFCSICADSIKLSLSVTVQQKSRLKIAFTTSAVLAHHASFHFVDGVEVEFLFAAVDALDDVVSLGVVVQNQQTGQLTMQMLAQTVANP